MEQEFLVGLTNIGDVVGYKKEDGKVVAIPEDYYTGVLILRILLMDFRKRTDMVLMKLYFFYLPDICQIKRN